MRRDFVPRATLVAYAAKLPSVTGAAAPSFRTRTQHGRAPCLSGNVTALGGSSGPVFLSGGGRGPHSAGVCLLDEEPLQYRDLRYRHVRDGVRGGELHGARR